MPFFSTQVEATSIKNASYCSQIIRIIKAAINAADPSLAVQRKLWNEDSQLVVDGKKTFPVDAIERIFIIGIGKAACPMTHAVHDILRNHKNSILVITKDGYLTNLRAGIQYLEAGHPVPDQRSIHAATEIQKLLKDTTQKDLVIFCISGGGSALVTLPVTGIRLEDLQALTIDMLKCGASIDEINTLRKHLDQMKGGQLASLAAPAPIITLILSDVVGDSLDQIASGPTVADPSTYQDAINILNKHQIFERVPETIRQHLEQGREGFLPETPKPGNPVFAQVANILVGSNSYSVSAAELQARAEGFNTLNLGSFIQGEAREVAKVISAITRQAALHNNPVQRPGCIVAGGETTVTIHGDGLGGRNQELALASVRPLAGLTSTLLVTISTDGTDGPTDAAGAVVTGETLSKATQLLLDPDEYLARNDSYHFFEKMDDLLKLGPTRTNVNDLIFVFTM